MLFLLLDTVNVKQKEKFELLYEHYKDLMMYISEKILRDPVIAEETVQEAFIKILLNIDDINEIICHETKSWIVLITKRVAINKLKHENRHNHLEDKVLEYTNFDSASLEDIAIQHITMDRVLYGLKMLDGKYSEIIILRYYFGYTDSKLAEHFNISPATVRKRCERGKNKLIIYLMDNGGEVNEENKRRNA